MSIALRFTFTVDGSLTDVTSVVLSEPGGTYGVKRNDTDAVVVADGTAMVNQSTGIYEYTFTEPAAGLEYTYYTEFVYNGNLYRKEFGYDDTSSTRPVTVAETKDHLRIDIDDDDTLIGYMIDAATEWAQMYTSRKYITASVVDYMDAFPTVIRPDWSPLISVTSIEYVDTDGAGQTLAASIYQTDTDTQPARITLAYTQSWPDIRSDLNAVTLNYTAGYGTSSSDVPEHVRNAIMMLVGSMYENREDTAPIAIHSVPMGVKVLLGIDRIVPI